MNAARDRKKEEEQRDAKRDQFTRANRMLLPEKCCAIYMHCVLYIIPMCVVLYISREREIEM